MVYKHYDVHPVDPLEEWLYPPFSATVFQGKIFARGAADNKGTLVARLFGLKKRLNTSALPCN
ncbi:hypothetical protein B9P99_02330 [Candidatus Marsarchaeota G1 archaeon OSP_B]|jgi:Acetylornithine deacetylase/Succinyl-diaminopimelate desuccinylase and related deacylases|uniref:Uncharacterized protein n=1 Tax=Candidatus Marsarchaeota G1 archaeon OSP_B TaxID=1978153 RepID=A0A2R6B4I5_9ARCH|nr:MAG: hypothetical protein B9P99_02330 [Candidatus Marsarchaeota G1 archaeon OSP_B]